MHEVQNLQVSLLRKLGFFLKLSDLKQTGEECMAFHKDNEELWAKEEMCLPKSSRVNASVCLSVRHCWRKGKHMSERAWEWHLVTELDAMNGVNQVGSEKFIFWQGCQRNHQALMTTNP